MGKYTITIESLSRLEADHIIKLCDIMDVNSIGSLWDDLPRTLLILSEAVLDYIVDCHESKHGSLLTTGDDEIESWRDFFERIEAIQNIIEARYIEIKEKNATPNSD